MTNIMKYFLTSKKEIRNQRDSAISQRNIAVNQRKIAENDRDRANIKQHQAESETSDLRTEQLERENFVATLSHDLRNPISLIKASIEAIESGINVKDMLSLMSQSADSAEELISHLLDANLIKSGQQLPINPEETSLKNIITASCSSFSDKKQSRLKIKNNSESLIGFWDEFSIQRAVTNLISNALKYSEVESVVTVCSDFENEDIKISVHNIGPVIPLKDQTKIFDGYFRSKSSSHLKQLGWGLGLTIVKGIVESHNGKVDLESNLEHGTTFTIRLPRYDLSLKP